jgi:hypothetical protein
MNPVATTAIVFACVFGGALLGMALRTVVPANHLDNETKDVVKLGVGLIGTMAALVLGLLVASAKSSYDTRSGELTQMAANTILLDRVLAHYGPDAGDLRAILRVALERMHDEVWPQDRAGPGGLSSKSASHEVIFDRIQELTPRTDGQRALQSEAETIAINIGQTRWLLFEQNGTAISLPFLVVVVFWLSLLFVSFGLFGPRNMTVAVTLFMSALSVAGAIFLIMELDRPFNGLIQISDAPLRNALAVLGK